MLRRTPLRRVSKSRAGLPRHIRTELDCAARELCFRNAGHCCERCGKRERLQWHHVYSRRYLSLRWEALNLIALCAGCHLWWHHNPLDAAAWFAERFGESRVRRLRLIMGTRKRTDLPGLLESLRSALAAKGGGCQSPMIA